MFTRNQLDPRVADLGLLIGLLGDSGDGDLSINTDWFSDPVTEILKSPTRLDALLTTLGSLFNLTAGTECTRLNQLESWYSIDRGADDLPSGLCLVVPKARSKSGLLSLGLFDQLFLDELTISIYARLPLFRLSDGAVPQFVLASHPANDNRFELTAEIFSSDFVQVDSDTRFNLMSATASVDLNNDFQTTFTLSFYEDFNPAKTDNQPLPPPDLNDFKKVIGGRLATLVTKANYWLNGYIADTPVTVGDLMSATGLVKQTRDQASGQVTYSFDDSTFLSDPTVVFRKFLSALLSQLLERVINSGDPLVSISDGGIYAVKDETTNEYGLRLTIPDFQLTAAEAPGAQVKVQMGKGFTGETTDNNWLQRLSKSQIDPGVEIFFLKVVGANISTTSRLQLNSVGLDISGAGGAPLINLKGYTLKGAELRTYLDSDGWKYGFGIRLDDVSFPVGPNFSQTKSGSATNNVVAQNLLAASDPSGRSSSDTSAVNPGFSAEASYISGHDPHFAVFDADGKKTDLIWFPIQRRFGPINCEKVGLKFDDENSDPVLGVIFDGGVALGGLSVYLDQLSIDAHLKQIANTSGYGMDLQGIDVDFSNGSVEVNAGLLKTKDKQGNICYDGEALIKGGNLTIAALGSYCSLPNNGGTSMFIFGVLNEPLGGPACFYVTGLMAGFGYNRALKLPDQDKVQDFPLLAGLSNPDAIGGANAKPADALLKLQDVVPIQRGEYWLAAGIMFTTFKIVDTKALIVVEFGDDLTIALLGLSVLKQPIFGDAYVYAELGIEVVILPNQGEFRASAVLAPSSYVLTPDAHLTGGFAFYSWFGSNEHAGDFVLTLGGYHPAFNVPAHYPQEPPLGINWQISSHLSMVGTAYFALTPSAMMAGCGIKVAYEDGDLKAWLKAQADIIIFWKPFYVIADISISVGVSYRLNLLFTHVTVSAEIGADFHLWGPPIGGKVHIDWYIISFTIGFGDPLNIPTEIAWNDFKEMLPAQTKPQPATSAPAVLRSAAPKARAMARPTPMLRAAAPAPNTPAYLNIASNDGLIRFHQADDLTLWLVRASQFKFSTGSAIPASALAVQGFNQTTNLPGTKVGVQRVNGGISPDDYQSQQTVTLIKVRAQTSKNDFSNIRDCMATVGSCETVPSGCELMDINGWEIDPVSKGMPQAMWGHPTAEASINADSSTITATIGVTMYPKDPVITNCTPEMVIDHLFEDRTVNVDDQFMLPLSQPATGVVNPPQDVDSFVDIAQVNDDPIVQRRSGVFAALAAMGVNAWTNGPLTATATAPGQAFADEPMEGSTVLSSS